VPLVAVAAIPFASCFGRLLDAILSLRLFVSSVFVVVVVLVRRIDWLLTPPSPGSRIVPPNRWVASCDFGSLFDALSQMVLSHLATSSFLFPYSPGNRWW